VLRLQVGRVQAETEQVGKKVRDLFIIVNLNCAKVEGVFCDYWKLETGTSVRQVSTDQWLGKREICTDIPDTRLRLNFGCAEWLW